VVVVVVIVYVVRRLKVGVEKSAPKRFFLGVGAPTVANAQNKKISMKILDRELVQWKIVSEGQN
jgi:hypothetical protein